MNNNQIVIIVFFALIAVFALYKFFSFWFAKHGGNEGWIAETKPSYFWRWTTIAFWKIFFKLYNRLEIRNAHFIPKESDVGFVTVANHASILDGFIMGMAVWRNFFILVKKEAFEMPLESYYLRKVYCFPVDRSKVDTVAIKRAMKVLADGDSLGLFPEGTRNREGFVSEFKPGAIKLALKKKSMIIPAYIGNSHKITPPHSIFPRPAKLTVTFLEPIDTAKEIEAGKTEQDILDMLYKRITDAGTSIMGYDVRDPEYIKKLSSENQQIQQKC